MSEPAHTHTTHVTFDVLLKRFTQIALCIIGFFIGGFILEIKQDVKSMKETINEVVVNQAVSTEKLKTMEKAIDKIGEEAEEDKDTGRRKR